MCYILFLVPPTTPTFSIGPNYVQGPVSVIQDTTLTITCNSTGNPTPVSGDYTWTGPGITSSHTGDVLTIENIQTSSSGQYTCRVTTTLTPTGGGSVTKSNQSSVTVDLLGMYQTLHMCLVSTDL